MYVCVYSYIYEFSFPYKCVFLCMCISSVHSAYQLLFSAISMHEPSNLTAPCDIDAIIISILQIRKLRG